MPTRNTSKRNQTVAHHELHSDHESSRAPMRGLGRTPLEQALVNLDMAKRVLALAPRGDAGGLVPHPLDVAIAELVNVSRYLALVQEVRISY